MASLLSMGAGASEGLDKYLQRALLEEQMTLAKQKQAADETYRNKALEQSGEQNRLTRESLDQNRQATLQAGLRDDERANIGRMTGGTEFTPERYSKVIGLHAAAPEQFDIQLKPDAPLDARFAPKADMELPGSIEKGATVPTEDVPGATGAGRISLRSTPQEVATTERLKDADERHRLSEENYELRKRLGLGNLDLRGRTENRLTEWGPTPVVVQNSDGSTGFVRRPDAVGKTAPKPASERTANDELGGLLELAENTLKEGDDSNWVGVGPVAGTLGKTIRDWTGADVAGGAKGQTNRQNLGELEAFSAFAQGGKNLTATERKMMNEYLANAKQNPKVARQSLSRAIESIKRRRSALMSGVVTPDNTGGGDEPVDDKDPAGLFR